MQSRVYALCGHEIVAAIMMQGKKGDEGIAMKAGRDREKERR